MHQLRHLWFAAISLIALVLVAGATAATSWNVNQNIQPGDTLTGAKTWTATYYKNGVAGDYGRVDFYVDGALKAKDTSRPFSYALDTTKLANGSHTFQVRAMNGSTERARETATATVSNTAPPPPPPTSGVTFVSPAAGATVSGSVKVEVTAPSNTAFIGVDACGLWLEDGSSLGGWTVDLDSTRCNNGSVTITAYAYSSSGAELGSAQRAVNVQNQQVTTQCNDGADNDADGKIDLADPGCDSSADNDETDPAPPPTGSEPAPIAGLGYHEVFRDNFDSFSQNVWSNHIWYDPNPPAGSIHAENGTLKLDSRRADGYPNIQATTLNAGGGDKVFTQGYFEARLKWTGGNGSWPAFWLFSQRHAENPSWPNVNPYCAANGLPAAQCYSSELDVFEGQGREPSTFYGTIHRNSCDCYGVPNTQNANNASDVSPKVLANQWHDYGVLWTASQVKWYLDGVLVHSAPTYDSTNQPMFLILTMQSGGWTGGTDSSTPDTLTSEFDYVTVWQK